MSSSFEIVYASASSTAFPINVKQVVYTDDSALFAGYHRTCVCAIHVYNTV